MNAAEECFRPLTGINFNSQLARYCRKVAFPSPHGDKFQLSRSNSIGVVVGAFPSPHGDKFQRTTFNIRREPCRSFRPLTGINFNEQLSTFAASLAEVSVPSRG